jgi:hypothetical protein
MYKTLGTRLSNFIFELLFWANMVGGGTLIYILMKN